MRYPAERSGRGGICPRCGRRWILPADAEGLPTAFCSHQGRQEKIGRRVAASPGAVNVAVSPGVVKWLR
jgi:hypothetical protein